ncbi:hypothetical protein ACNQ2I_00365 [Mycoplasma sp. Z355B]|uniref:hypothetical protein n=1 Tax=Mycoplasma sp. Z355B TaxID=3401689 RepID=UPI003AAFD672
MNTDLYNGYKKIKGLNIAFLVLIFLCIFFLILWLILFALNTVNMTNSMDGNNNSTPNFEDIFGGVQLIPFVFLVITLIAIGICMILNIVFVCITNTAGSLNQNHDAAKTLTWVGFGLTFCLLPIGNIILIVSASQAMHALASDQRTAQPKPNTYHSNDIF